jgi:hypothetical protein
VDRRRHGRQEHRRVEVFDTAGHLDAAWQPLVACVARISRLTFDPTSTVADGSALTEH